MEEIQTVNTLGGQEMTYESATAYTPIEIAIVCCMINAGGGPESGKNLG